MREALHVNNQQLYFIPQDLSDIEIENHKQNANKGTFICPYCDAKLKVRSGPVLGNYFAHLHGEGCEPSKQSEARFNKYEHLKKDDTPRHPQILAMMFDELDVLSKVYNHISCNHGYLDTTFSKYIPDITLKIHDHHYAITIFTKISSSSDTTKAKNIQKQRDYYASLGYEPLFFIERSNLAIDIDGHSLVLWASEREALSTQASDLHWKNFLSNLAPLDELHHYLNVPATALDIKSILYITPADQSIAIEAFHVLEQPHTAPPKAYFFSKPYKLTFAQAFKLANNTLTLANMQIEMENQARFAEKLKQTKILYLEEQEKLEQKRQQQVLEEKFKKEQRRRVAEEKTKDYQESIKKSAYNRADKTRRMELLQQAYRTNN